MKEPKQTYETGRIAVDAVICSIKDDGLWVYLNAREKAPFRDLAELPGGLLLPDETADQTLLRKVTSAINVKTVFAQQFHTFTEPKRDPRMRTVTIAYIALVPAERVTHWEHFQNVADLPKLAFDHHQIIVQARRYLRHQADTTMVKHLLPKHFPLNQAQIIYEVLQGEKIDNRNFRKKLLNSGDVVKVDQVQKQVAHRPAALYRFSG